MEIKKYWKYYLTFVLLLVIAGFSPVIFTGTWSYFKFSSQTGPIGDTIGGLTAPFMSLAGSILVFLALKEQIRANELVIDNFKNEKAEKSQNQKLKWEIFLLDLDAILKETKEKLELLNNYIKEIEKNPFSRNILNKTITNNHLRISSINRDIIFLGFKEYFIDDNNWKNSYHRLYEILDFLPLFFNELYKKNDDHVFENFKIKKEIGNSIEQLMNEIVIHLKFLENEYSSQYHISKEVEILNQFLIDYHLFIEENPFVELNKISDFITLNLTSKLIEQDYILRNHLKTTEILIRAKEIKTEIFKVHQSEIDFNIHLKELYDSFVIDISDRKGTYNEFNELVNLLKKTMS